MKKINSQIREYLKYCEKVCGMTEATISSKKYIYHRFVKESGLTDLHDLTNTVFNTWAAKETDRGIRPTTMNSYNAAILALVRYYNDIGEIIPLNVRLIHIVKQPRSERKVYTAQEIHQVIYLTSRSSRHRKVSLMIRIMFETGMRIAELSKLRVTDFNGRRIDFIGKGRKAREVYIRPNTLKKVQRFIEENQITDYLWCVNGSDQPPTTHTVRVWMQEAFAFAGFDGFYPHSLRHSFATDLQLRGASIEEIKEMIGHESIATTERYLHGFEGRLKSLFDKYR